MQDIRHQRNSATNNSMEKTSGAQRSGLHAFVSPSCPSFSVSIATSSAAALKLGPAHFLGNSSGFSLLHSHPSGRLSRSRAEHIDEIGGPKAYNHIPVGWAWAVNAPFQWGKQVASHLGGTRNPVVISWPGHISDPGGKRWQFHHVIDLVPTTLEAAGIPQPTEVNGVQQKPIEGISMLYTFKDPNAAEQRHIQYFEMFALQIRRKHRQDRDRCSTDDSISGTGERSRDGNVAGKIGS
jgi:arylsulfatase A-like enzyme